MPVWPDNWAAVRFFASVGLGAWSIGPRGATGIRPEAFREIRLALGVGLAAWREMYPDVMAMEAAALDAMREGA